MIRVIVGGAEVIAARVVVAEVIIVYDVGGIHKSFKEAWPSKEAVGVVVTYMRGLVRVRPYIGRILLCFTHHWARYTRCHGSTRSHCRWPSTNQSLRSNNLNS